ncbi:hypothetical protein HNV11_06240 [Spirosoma taeanense]|uniref:Uncharacterized protein n=1 Tax=Spirosoma taeanense TaxID=2735870 RepID=A0A6M5Y6B7_9BACT|nr:hypothetical protein [Spirosoma taeanense]QJW89014.1 hypothetical protein HNV11_06240 [Spirosoma taeanense]
MSFTKRVRTLSFDSLYQLIDQAHHEINRRQQFIEHVPALRLRDLPLSVRARDLLYRTIAEKKKLVYWQDAEKLNLSETLKLLVAEDWMQIRYKNVKAYDEIRTAFHTYKAPLERYYGNIESNVSV